jgi:tRNA threonylcarbamoyladenosine modification (KEOPS) complex  Pcc1 subunit
MKLGAQIIVTEDVHNIKKLFEAEEKVFANKRADYELDESGNKLIFRINAKDSTALKAVLNSITKMLIVYEAASNVVKKA